MNPKRFAAVLSVSALVTVTAYAAGDAQDSAPGAPYAQLDPQERQNGFAAIEQHSDVVRQVQQALSDEGYDVGPVDGVMGPETRAALTQFQQDEGLEPSGRLDASTLSALDIDLPAVFAPFVEDEVDTHPDRGVEEDPVDDRAMTEPSVEFAPFVDEVEEPERRTHPERAVPGEEPVDDRATPDLPYRN